MQHKILHVEDNPDDVMLVGLAFNKAGASAKLEVATDGEKAIAALQRSSDSLPVCVLLDIKLPSISGFEVPFLDPQPTTVQTVAGRHAHLVTAAQRHQPRL